MMARPPPSFPFYNDVPPPSSVPSFLSYFSIPPHSNVMFPFDFGIPPTNLMFPTSSVHLPYINSHLLVNESHPCLQNAFATPIAYSTDPESPYTSNGTSMLDPPNLVDSIFQPPSNVFNPHFSEIYFYPQSHFPPNAYRFNQPHYFTYTSTPFPTVPPTNLPPFAPPQLAPNTTTLTFTVSYPAYLSMLMAIPSLSIQPHQILNPWHISPQEETEWESLVTDVYMIEPGHECTVCFEFFEIERVMYHFYHEDCIAPWLDRT